MRERKLMNRGGMFFIIGLFMPFIVFKGITTGENGLFSLFWLILPFVGWWGMREEYYKHKEYEENYKQIENEIGYIGE